MGGEKFMLTYKEEESAVAQLTRRGGGACVGKTATAVVVGWWKKDKADSNGKTQNMEDCFKLVQEMTAYLMEQGHIYFKTGEKYVGQFRNGMLARGKWIYPSGSNFERNFGSNQLTFLKKHEFAESVIQVLQQL